MKTFFYLILTSLVSTFAGFGALGSKAPAAILCCLGIVLAVWTLFFWGWNKRVKKASAKRSRERLFANHMRTHMRNSDLR